VTPTPEVRKIAGYHDYGRGSGMTVNRERLAGSSAPSK
jgi:hypothetical protein